eukprot:scaffold38545_cov21-Tisochrysis_lutea.AAC.1
MFSERRQLASCNATEVKLPQASLIFILVMPLIGRIPIPQDIPLNARRVQRSYDAGRAAAGMGRFSCRAEGDGQKAHGTGEHEDS